MISISQSWWVRLSEKVFSLTFILFSFVMFSCWFPTGFSATFSTVAFFFALPLFFYRAAWKNISLFEKAGLALFTWLFLSISWSQVGFVSSLVYLFEYRLYFMVPVYAAALLCLPNTQNWAFCAAVTGAVIALITSYGLGLGWWTVEGANLSLGNRIYHGFIMSVLLLIALLVARDFTGGIRYGAIVIAVLTVYNVLNIEIGRTGYLQVTAVTFTYVALTFRRLQAVIVGLVVLIVLGVVYVSSDQVNHRVSQTLTNVENAIFEGGHASSSVGYRLDFYRGAIQIGADNPLGGVGVGDVVAELEDRTDSGQMRFTTDNVHSEFLNMLVAGGLPALCLFLLFCLSMFWAGFRHRKTNRTTADSLIGMSVIVLVSAMFNSTIKDYGEKHALLIILSLLVARLFCHRVLPKRSRAIPTPFKAQ